jgi:hypothetical protein
MSDIIRRLNRREALQATVREALPATVREALQMAVSGLLVVALLAAPALARNRVPVHARAGLDLAGAAATAWAPDAFLVYIENDEPLDSHGAAPRWGYLYYSPTLKKARVYSVRDGKIVVAEDLGMKFEAPPIAGEWIDSAKAFTISDEGPALRFCFEHAGRLDTMLLMRGAIQEDQPDRTTWMLVYTAPNLPSLFVVLDAADGTVLRTWRG